MNHAELIADVARRSDSPQTVVERIYKALLASVDDGLKTGGRVRLRGFGVLEMRSVAERRGRNPRTGAEITIPASRKVAFKPATGLGPEE